MKKLFMALGLLVVSAAAMAEDTQHWKPPVCPPTDTNCAIVALPNDPGLAVEDEINVYGKVIKPLTIACTDDLDFGTRVKKNDTQTLSAKIKIEGEGNSSVSVYHKSTAQAHTATKTVAGHDFEHKLSNNSLPSSAGAIENTLDASGKGTHYLHSKLTLKASGSTGSLNHTVPVVAIYNL